MPAKPRPYQKRRRAALEAETRRRITESAVALHGTLGPSQTSFSAVAAHAGVRRSTLYRHFPDETALFNACGTHWAAHHPRPVLAGWTADDPDARLRSALTELYAYYRSVERMMGNLLRDESVVPELARRLQGFHQYLKAAGDILMKGRPTHGHDHRLVRAAVGHALAFGTWRSLVREEGLEERQAVELLCQLVRTPRK